MYILQEREKNYFNEIWTDITTSKDYDFILKLARAYSDKYKNHRYRVIEVFVYV